jgi:cytochrome P450
MVEFSPYAYEFHEDPYPLYAQLREEAPVYHNAEGEFWALSRHADVMAAFKDTQRFSNSHGVSIDPAARGAASRLGTSFLAMDPPQHTRLRGFVSKGFTPRRVSALGPRVRALSVGHLDRLVGVGGFDAIQDFAGKLPMDVISEMMGVPEPDRDALRAWADAMVHRDEGVFDVPPEGVAGFGNIRSYFQEHIAKLRAQPSDDLLSALLELEKDGEGFDELELLSFCNLMITAGNETTTKLLGNGLYCLWQNPDQRELIRTNPEHIPLWVEETLRYDNSTQALMRITTEDVTIDGVTIPANQYVLLLVGAANRDPDVFENPDVFDIHRDTTAMLSFGKGVHFCMGAALARLEACVAFEEWWKRFPDYAVDPSGIVRVHSVNVRGFSKLPIKI